MILHLALAVADLEASIADYSRRLGCEPAVVVAGAYALWRTPAVNLSVRVDPQRAGSLRHLGWEDPAASGFSAETDVNGIVWERFSAGQQEQEIRDIWPQAFAAG